VRLPDLPGLLIAALVLLAAAIPGGAGRPPRGLPAIVFVSRHPVPDGFRAIPGLGPHHRAIAVGGRLMLREPDGRVRELLPGGAFYDVSDPSVSPDARRVAFAGLSHPDSAWRLWIVGLDDGPARQVTFSDPAPPTRARADDLDPCWIDDSTLVFASTRYPQRAQYADLPVTNLFITGTRSTSAGPAVMRITAERNGAEEPAMDWMSGRLVFARWWFNRYLAAPVAAGITTDPRAAFPRDTVNLWQLMTMSLADRRQRLVGADLRTRRGTMGYQPAILADGAIASVYAANLGLSPGPGGTGIHVVSPWRPGEARLAGALVSGRAGDAYRGTEGLAPPSACSPAALPDGRIVFSYDPGARGDFGLYLASQDGERIERLLDLPGTLELDPAPVVARRSAPRQPPPAGDEREDPEAFARALAAGRTLVDAATPPAAPPADPGAIPASAGTFRFHDLDVFADGAADGPARGAAPRTPGTRIRFFATLARPDQPGGDSVFLVREAPVGPTGEVNERGLPAGLPMFEQLVGPDDRVLMTAHGPAHVAGLNAGVAGTASRCVGCHLGHSTLPLSTGSGGRR
jgi:hypothetical protein